VGLKGVLVDFGYTLMYIDDKVERKYREGIISILRRHGYDETLDCFSSFLDEAYRNNRAGETKNMREFWVFLTKSLGVSMNPMLIHKLEKHRKQYMDKTYKLYDGAIFVLSNLSEKYKLALVSNCAPDLSDVIEALGLHSFFESIILSYKVGTKKPDIRIYLEALRGLELKPEECIFVADEITDLEGARRAGLKTILVRQEPRARTFFAFHDEIQDPNFKPDYECGKIIEVLKFI